MTPKALDHQTEGMPFDISVECQQLVDKNMCHQLVDKIVL